MRSYPLGSAFTITFSGYPDDAGVITTPATCTIYDSDDVQLQTGGADVVGGVIAFATSPLLLTVAGTCKVLWTGVVDGAARQWWDYFELRVPSAPDFATYTATGGKLTEAEFTRLLPAAQATVDEAIWPNAVTTASRAAYERAVCAVIDVLEREGVLSEQVGATQVSYASANVSAMAGLSASPVYAAIRRHLSGSGLLYRGI